MSFFDTHDNYKFETEIPTSDVSWIDYIEMINCWVTVNKAGVLETWDLSTLTSTPWIKILDSNLSLVNDSAELARTKLYAIGTSDKRLFILDPIRKLTYKTIYVPTEGINKLKYMSCFSVLVVAGFSRYIPIYELNIRHRELTRKGELHGHDSNIAVVEIVENSPTVITVDDVPTVKVWDIRTFKCIQTLDFKIGTTIINMVAIPEHQKLAIVSTRVSVIELHPFYGDKYSNLLDPMNRELVVSDVVFDSKRKLFCIFSNRGILEISVANGATKRIITNSFNPEAEDDLGKCDFIIDQSIALLTNLNGGLIFQDVILNEGILTVGGSKKEILTFYLDEENGLLLVAGYDNTVKVYHEPQKFDFTRREKLKSSIVSDCVVNPKSIIAGIEQHSTHKFFDYSLKYDVMISVFFNKLVFFSVDTYRLILVLTLPGTLEVTSFKLLRDRGIFLLGLSSEEILIAKITKRNFSKIEVQPVGVVHLMQYRGLVFKEVNRLRRLKLAICLLLKELGIIFSDVKASHLAEPIRVAGLMPVFTEMLGSDSDVELLVGTAEGIFIKLNRSSSYKQRLDQLVEKRHDITVKSNFNFGKRVMVNYVEQLQYAIYETVSADAWMASYSLKDFKVEKVMNCRIKDPKCMKVITIGSTPYIVSVINPCYLLVLNMNLMPQCKLNINHPLPLYWNLKVARDREATQKISEIGKFFTHMLIYYEQSFLTTDEQRKEKFLADIIRQLVQNEDQLEISQIETLLHELEDIEAKIGKVEVTLMKDSYHPKDMVYKRIRKENLQEIAGPNLYQMDRRRKFTKQEDPEVKITDNPHLRNLLVDNFEEKIKADIEAKFAEFEKDNKDEKVLKRRLSKEFRTTDNFYKEAEKNKLQGMTVIKRQKKGSLSTSKVSTVTANKKSPRKPVIQKKKKSVASLLQDSGLLVIDEDEDKKPTITDIFNKHQGKGEVLSPLLRPHPKELTLSHYTKAEPSFQQSPLLPVDSKTQSINHSFEQAKEHARNKTASNFFLKQSGAASKSIYQNRSESVYSIHGQTTSQLDNRSSHPSQKKLTDPSVSYQVPVKIATQAATTKGPPMATTAHKWMTHSTHWLQTGKIPPVKPEYGTKLEKFLKEANIRMFRSTSGEFEIRKRDCYVAGTDKNLSSFVKSIDLKKKRAKHGIK